MQRKTVRDRIPEAWRGPLRPLWQQWKHRPHCLRRVAVDRPVFVVGHPRSGTSWLYKLLVLHPEFAGAPESHLFDYYLKPFLDEDPFSPWGGVDYWLDRSQRPALLRGIVDRIFAYRLAEEQKRRVVEKTPEHALSVMQIKELYPKAQFIHIVRDGRDVMLSVLAYAHNLQNPPEDLGEGAKQWCATLESVAQSRLHHDADILELRYEDIVANPGPHVRRMFEFLGERCPDGLVDEILVKYPPSTKSIGKWHDQLRADENEAFVEVARPWLEKLNYELQAPVRDPRP
jgi:Sulfotransferase family